MRKITPLYRGRHDSRFPTVKLDRHTIGDQIARTRDPRTNNRQGAFVSIEESFLSRVQTQAYSACMHLRKEKCKHMGSKTQGSAVVEQDCLAITSQRQDKRAPAVNIFTSAELAHST
ncbi:uncharacterized protein LOC116249829 isoform X3 [Nymphaea colorata]|uniref:uncharacterized protein LOC116249829 isoform X3 n=1 Tax=Nymphaea colorata TaxID=210225 RepID=UPI00129DFCA6|nr:uncharacterized protein LOC116249829 isoform X3 [Nymphaea colorata]